MDFSFYSWSKQALIKIVFWVNSKEVMGACRNPFSEERRTITDKISLIIFGNLVNFTC